MILVGSLVKRIRKYLDRKLLQFINKVMPTNRKGDYIYSLMDFIFSNGRLPNRRNSFNDEFWKIKVSNEILHPLRIMVSDKEYSKLFVKSVIGDQFNVPTIDVLRSSSELENYDFPSRCCVKPTHKSGGVTIRSHGEPIDLDSFTQWFTENWYRRRREANYRYLTPKVIVEPLIFDQEINLDYKFFCFNGEPKLIQVDVDRYSDHRRKFFDTCWQDRHHSILFPEYEKHIEKPANLDEMLAISRELSSYFNLIRIDMYTDGNVCLVGELTNIHGNAGESFIPRESEIPAGELIFGQI